MFYLNKLLSVKPQSSVTNKNCAKFKSNVHSMIPFTSQNKRHKFTSKSLIQKDRNLNYIVYYIEM